MNNSRISWLAVWALAPLMAAAVAAVVLFLTGAFTGESGVERASTTTGTAAATTAPGLSPSEA